MRSTSLAIHSRRVARLTLGAMTIASTTANAGPQRGRHARMRKTRRSKDKSRAARAKTSSAVTIAARAREAPRARARRGRPRTASPRRRKPQPAGRPQAISAERQRLLLHLGRGLHHGDGGADERRTASIGRVTIAVVTERVAQQSVERVHALDDSAAALPRRDDGVIAPVAGGTPRARGDAAPRRWPALPANG